MKTAEKTEQKETFSYDGYQVVRGEFFAHTFEPSITFNDNKVYVNMACLKQMWHKTVSISHRHLGCGLEFSLCPAHTGS